jgi:hypothetical protein
MRRRREREGARSGRGQQAEAAHGGDPKEKGPNGQPSTRKKRVRSQINSSHSRRSRPVTQPPFTTDCLRSSVPAYAYPCSSPLGQLFEKTPLHRRKTRRIGLWEVELAKGAAWSQPTLEEAVRHFGASPCGFLRLQPSSFPVRIRLPTRAHPVSCSEKPSD